MAATFNKLAVRKEIGAIGYRLVDHGTNPHIRDCIIERHLCNLLDDLPREYWAPIVDARLALAAGDIDDVGACIEELKKSLPPPTYGEIPAGTRFRWPHNEEHIATKRKGCVDVCGTPVFHLEPGTIVTIII